jgi:hypothetical protein
MRGGECFKFVAKKWKLSEKQSCIYFAKMVDALGYFCYGNNHISFTILGKLNLLISSYGLNCDESNAKK